MEKKTISTFEFLEQHPEVEKDITLLKIIFIPLEMWILKYIIHDSYPHTTRDIYTQIIHSIFSMNFLKTEDNISEGQKKAFNYLKLEDFTASWQLTREKKRIGKEWHYKTKDKSFTETIDEEAKLLTKYKTKHPSYEGIRTILQEFHRIGILVKRKAHGKEYWIINPHFYKTFKDKFKEILAL